MNAKSILTAVAILIVAVGCNTISVETKQNIAAPNFPPTDPATVQVLDARPPGGWVFLGDINMTVEGKPTKAAIQTKFRTAAAKMGANAVVVVSDRIVVLSTYISGPAWGQEASPITGRQIIVEAIRITP